MLTIRTIRGDEEIERVAHLTALVFGKDDYQSLYDYMKLLYRECSFFSPEKCWVADIDGRIVSRVQVIDYEMQIGSIPVKMGGIAAVLTDPEYRRQGLAAKVMRRAVEFMMQEKYDVSVLYGIRGYYERFGFVPAMPEYEIIIDPSDLSLMDTDAFKPFTPEDQDRLLAIYSVSNSQRTGTIRRTSEFFKFERRKPAVILIGDRGYIGINIEADEVVVKEVAATDAGFYRDALAHIAAIAQDEGKSRIRCFVPVDHPFAVETIAYGGELRIRYNRTGGCMARITSVRSLMGKITPELERRLLASAYKDVQLHLNISTDIGDVSVRLGRESMTRRELNIDIPQTGLTQLVFGYKPAKSILTDIDPKDGELLNVLFPQGYPYVWMADRF